MRIAIYRTSDGWIRQWSEVPYSHADIQCNEGEDYFLNCPGDATHIIGGVPVVKPIILPVESVLAEIRSERNRRLAACDWTQVVDAPANKSAWAAYRQHLRDFPAVCDPYNPIWPAPPA